MRLRWVELRDFRNHRATALDVPDGLVVAVGPNGEGKTNLLEGVHYLCDLASPRVSGDLPLVRMGASSAYVRGEVETLGGRVLIEVEVRGSGANRVQVNRSPARRKRDVRGRVRAVFFGPDDERIGQGDPDRRRGFMEEAVLAIWPLRETAMRSYEKALRQRNRLLKEWDGSGSAPRSLDAWDEELVAAGAQVTHDRAEAIERLRGPAGEEFEALTTLELLITYLPSVPVSSLNQTSGTRVPPVERIADAFRERLAERRGDELVRRSTLVGPHRDELDLKLRELVVRGFASHGESWAAALALRIGQARATAAEAGEPPITLLDDPFSGIDPIRAQRLSDRLAAGIPGLGQVLVSTPDEREVPAGAVTWRVRAGTVEGATHEEVG